MAAVFLFAALPAGSEDPSKRVESLLGTDPTMDIAPPKDGVAIGTVTRDGEAVAYFASSHDLIGTVGYSGSPVDVLVVVKPDGTVRAATLLAQTEPILTLGISAAELESFVAGFAGANVRESIRVLQESGSVPDAVSGATVSSGVIRDAILRTGRTALEMAGRNEASPSKAPAPDESWEELVAAGTVSTRTVSFDEARKAMAGATGLPEGDGVFAEIAAAIIDGRETGLALLGSKVFDKVSTAFAADDRLLLVAGRGVYSIKGTQWRKSGIFERLELSAGGRTIPLAAAKHERLGAIAAAGAPDFRETMLIGFPASAGLEAGESLTLQLVVDKTSEGASSVARFAVGPLGGGPRAAASPSGPVEEPLWLENWRAATPQLAILAVMLTVLFFALYISGPIVRRPWLYEWFRTGFLLVTLVWLGWIAGAQISVVQVVAFLQSLMSGFRWDVFLLAPLIFTLWAFIALGVLFWGRGVYCGWLCPFGALQELLHKAGQRMGIKRIEIPWEIHERLWPIKYVALLAIIGLSLQDQALAFKAAEVEPFKTAIVMRFMRAWPYVAYAVALLAAGLFVERAYCRYLCPLGAALAIPSKFKIFDWLIRRPQCGRECRLCATTCTVQAIDPIGRINPNECIYCLKCQVNYHDPETCVPLKMRARRRSEGSVAEAVERAAAPPPMS